MYNFQSIKELLNTLSRGNELLSEMFSKRKSFDYKYSQAIALDNYDENRVDSLIEKGIVTRNGRYLEVEDQLLTFFEQILDVNEEINVSLVQENIKVLRENIEYYLKEDSEHRKYKYLKSVKASLRKLGFICLRNIIDLNRNIDNAFKTEPNYKIKIKKLENYDQRRVDIKKLIAATDKLVTEEERTFFATAVDDQLNHIVVELRLQLQEARHNLIETEKQIIDFLNQVKHQSRVMEKIRQVKYLKDQFELESCSDIKELVTKDTALAYEARLSFPLKLSLDLLQDDDIYTIISKLNQKVKVSTKKTLQLAKKIDSTFFEETEEENIFIDLQEMRNNFMASGYHLLDFVMQYDYPREVNFEEKIACYCQLISLYESDFYITDAYATLQNSEFSVVYPQ